jgi:hypothetical protein
MGLIQKPEKTKKYGYYLTIFDMLLEEAIKSGYAEVILDDPKEYQNIYANWRVRGQKGTMHREKRFDGNVYAVLTI